MISNITDDIIYIGVNDHDTDLFEGQYIVPNGMAYNSYIIKDDKIAIMDTVDGRFGKEWIANIEEALGTLVPDYLIIQHMEPDHSANIELILEKYPELTLVGNDKTFVSFCSQQTPSVSSAHLMSKKTGLVKHEDIILESLENMACRLQDCLEPLLRLKLTSYVRYTDRYLARILIIIFVNTLYGHHMSLRISEV